MVKCSFGVWIFWWCNIETTAWAVEIIGGAGIENLNAIIGVPENKDDFAIEVYSDTGTFAEIEHGSGKISMRVYPHPKNDYWDIDLSQLLSILEKAKKELL